VQKKTSYPSLGKHWGPNPPLGNALRVGFLKNLGRIPSWKILNYHYISFKVQEVIINNQQGMAKIGFQNFSACMVAAPTDNRSIAETSLKNRIETWQTTALNYGTPKAGQSGINFSNLLFGIVICQLLKSTVEVTNCFSGPKRHPTKPHSNSISIH